MSEPFRRSKVFGEMAIKLALEEIGFQTTSLFKSKDQKSVLRDESTARSGQVLLDGLTQLRGSGLKILQNLALEDDFLPAPLVKKLESAFGQVEPLSAPVVRKLLRVELGHSPEEIFASFDDRAFAAASLGQVHRAKLKTGDDVVIKIQYPNIARDMQSEIGLLTAAANAVTNPLIQSTVAEIANHLLWEVDYQREAACAERFREFWLNRGIVIPRMYPEHSTAHVLVQEFIPGDNLLRHIQTQVHVPPTALRAAFDFFFDSLFDLEAVHFDPHPGNFILIPDGRLAVVDFGAVKLNLPRGEIDLMRALTSASLNRTAVLDGYRKLGAVIGENQESPFFDEVVLPYFKLLSKILHQPVCDFSRHHETVRALRRAIFAQSSNPSLKNFTPELSTVHKASISLFQMLAKLGAKIDTRGNAR